MAARPKSRAPPAPHVQSPVVQPPQERHLSYGKRGKVVVEDEAFLGFAFETFEALHIVAGAQRRRYQGLGFAPREDGAAVSAGQDSGFDPDFANFIESAGIGTALLFQNFFAEDALAESFEILFELGLGFFVVFGNFRLLTSS